MAKMPTAREAQLCSYKAFKQVQRGPAWVAALLASTEDARNRVWGAVVQAQLHAHHAQGAGVKVVLHPRSLHGHVHSSPCSLRST